MSTEVLVAIIPAGGAIIAAIIAGIFSIIKPKNKETNDGVIITNNKRTKISKTTMGNGVTIDSNVDLSLEEGKLNEPR